MLLILYYITKHTLFEVLHQVHLCINCVLVYTKEDQKKEAILHQLKIKNNFILVGFFFNSVREKI